jgi:flagellin-like hook-associated protein FlgL
MADITLSSAMRNNLINLQQTAAALSQTQNRLATGKKVNSALDNPTNYFAASAHMSRANDLTARKDAMSEAIQGIKASDTGVTGLKTLLETLKGVVQTAASTSASGLSSLYTQFNTIAVQAQQLISDSGYKGTNYLNGTSITLDVLFNETGSNKLTVTGFDAQVSGLLDSANTGVSTTIGNYSALLTAATGITNISAFADSGGTAGFSLASNLASISAGLTAAISQLGVQSATMAGNLAVVNARLDFTNSMVNVEKAGADNLTLADQNEEGANMLTLQTRNQLATSSLSLASQAAQSILKLF